MNPNVTTIERKGTAVEFKFLGDGETGQFEGYGSIYNNIDSYGDMVMPGAFAASLAEHKAAGTMPGLYAEHSIYMGGDLLPVGAWNEITEDGRGLRVKGKISALDTDHGRRVRSLMQDGALRGLSIAFTVRPGGAAKTGNKKPGEAKRLLKAVDLASVDIVRDPSNPAAVIDQVKSLMAMVDHQAACKAVAAAIGLHRATMAGSDSPNVEERSQMLQHLKDAHKALTGQEMPSGMKSMPLTIRELEQILRDGGCSNTLARAFAEHGFKSSLLPREEGKDTAIAATRAALDDLGPSLAGFTLS